MNKLKKFAGILLALVMCFGLTCTAFAATTEAGDGDGTITITNPVEGETYSVYKMLDLSYNTTTKSYSYTVATGWEDFFNGTYDSSITSYFTVDSDGYVTSTLSDNDSALATVAKTALAYAQSKDISATASVTADSTSATITGLDLGYYLVDTTLGTLCSIDSTDTTAEIVEKNSDTPTEDKTVANSEDGAYSDSNTASIGDTVYYKVVLTNLANKSNVTLTDTMTSGLTLDTTSITVYKGETVVTSGYSVTSSTTGYTITFTDDFLATLSSSDVITVTYSAKINENAVIGTDGNTNSAVLSYGTGHTVTDTTKTTVFEFELEKVDATTGEQLSGATFTLKDSNGNVVNVTKQSDGSYKVDPNGTDTITVGKATITGLAAGTYYLTEVTAPDGYNKLTTDTEVVISADGTAVSIQVKNSAGSELPSTGGIGTTIFYVVGGVLVVGAVVLLITKKRMSE